MFLRPRPLSEFLWLQTSGFSGAQDRPCSKRQESPSQWVEFFVSIDGFLHIEVTEKNHFVKETVS